ncbi:sigma factor [Micromonospora echinofusca]|uniref:sigma factor n=1 Tax=Micromonospora echinofusca TaxID=47858 RepID=UPI003F4CF654
MADRLARRYAGRGEPYDDLAQVSALALVRAVDGFDVERGVPFPGYAVPSILGALRRHFRDTTWAMRVPRRAQELNSRMRAVTAELTRSRATIRVPRNLPTTLRCASRRSRPPPSRRRPTA